MRNVEEENENYLIARKQLGNILKNIDLDVDDDDDDDEDINENPEDYNEGYTFKMNIVSMRSIKDNDKIQEIACRVEEKPEAAFFEIKEEISNYLTKNKIKIVNVMILAN